MLQDRSIFPVSLAVTRISGVGEDSLFMGVFEVRWSQGCWGVVNQRNYYDIIQCGGAAVHYWHQVERKGPGPLACVRVSWVQGHCAMSCG